MPVERKHKQSEAIANFNYWLNDAINQDDYEEMIFFYHKDHLGSSTQISDGGANIIQHIEYMPYGEPSEASSRTPLKIRQSSEQTFFERRDYWNTPYKFNAKELDAELRSNRRIPLKINNQMRQTGMYYYGARYYTPEVSIWLSVDNMCDLAVNVSPYAYCFNNPIKYIDPDGNWPDGPRKNRISRRRKVRRAGSGSSDNGNGKGIMYGLQTAWNKVSKRSHPHKVRAGRNALDDWQQLPTASGTGNSSFTVNVPDDILKVRRASHYMESTNAVSRFRVSAKGAFSLGWGPVVNSSVINPSSWVPDPYRGCFMACLLLPFQVSQFWDGVNPLWNKITKFDLSVTSNPISGPGRRSSWRSIISIRGVKYSNYAGSTAARGGSLKPTVMRPRWHRWIYGVPASTTN